MGDNAKNPYSEKQPEVIEDDDIDELGVIIATKLDESMTLANICAAKNETKIETNQDHSKKPEKTNDMQSDPIDNRYEQISKFSEKKFIAHYLAFYEIMSQKNFYFLRFRKK